MCNQVHATEFKEIPQKGTGWKIFRKMTSTYYMEKSKVTWIGPLYGIANTYMYKDKNGFITWSDKKYRLESGWVSSDDDYGFCFFLTREDARKASKKCCIGGGVKVIKKIQYDGGRGSFLSGELDGEWRRFAIAKKFKIIEGR